MRQTGILVSPEVPLEDPPVGGTVEERPPCLELPDPVRGLLRVQLGHSEVVHILTAAHGIGEMHLPVVAVIHVCQSGGNSALGHDGVRLPEQRLTHQTNLDPCGRGGDRGAESCATGADNQHIVLEGLVFAHQILQSVQIPIEHSLTYKSANATENRLIQAHRMWARLKQLEQS